MPSVREKHSCFFIYTPRLIFRCLFLVPYALLSIYYMSTLSLLLIKLYCCLTLKPYIGGHSYTIRSLWSLTLKSVTFLWMSIPMPLWHGCFHCRTGAHLQVVGHGNFRGGTTGPPGTWKWSKAASWQELLGLFWGAHHQCDSTCPHVSVGLSLASLGHSLWDGDVD